MSIFFLMFCSSIAPAAVIILLQKYVKLNLLGLNVFAQIRNPQQMALVSLAFSKWLLWQPSALCSQHISYAHVTLTFHYLGETIEIYKKMEVSASILAKILMQLQVNDSKSEREGENGSYEDSEQGEEGKTSLVKLGSEGLGRIINEVKCVLYLWRWVGFTEANPIFTEKTGLLLCSLRRSPAAQKRKGNIHSGFISHLQCGQKKKEWSK